MIFWFLFIHTGLVKDYIILHTCTEKTCTCTEKTPEHQINPINLPRLQLQKLPQEPEMNKECGRQDRSVCSGPPCVKYEKMWVKQGKLECKAKLKPSQMT